VRFSRSLIRVAIFADTLLRAQNFANLLAEDERLEIVDTRAWLRPVGPLQIPMADVILAVAVRLPEQLAEGPPIVLISGEPPRQASFTRSIRAWLPEHASPAEIAAAIVAAAQDLTALTQAQVRLWLQNVDAVESGERPPVESLTPRERQVLRMMADGLANKEIAAQLAISEHTAKFHVAQILAKLGAATRAEAVTIGIRRGLVPI
jgi:DNA-binding NarL/FixJ family response regulator